MNVSRTALGALATSLHLHPSIIVSTAFSISKGSYRILLGLRQPARGVGTAHIWQDSISSDRKTFTLTANNKESLSDDVNSSSSQKEASTTTKKKKTKTDAEKGWTTERSILPKLWQPKEEDDTQCFTIVSWNVNGLRSVIRKDPQALSDLLSRTQCHPDVICLQETKLQVMHVGDDKLGLKGLLEEEGNPLHISSCAVILVLQRLIVSCIDFTCVKSTQGIDLTGHVLLLEKDILELPYL